MTKRSKKQTMSADVKKLYDALNTISDFFTDEVKKGEHHDPVSGVVIDQVTVNRLAYTQRAVLDGLCWKAQAEVERLEGETLPRVAADLSSLIRRRGSPHGANIEQMIASKTSYIEQLEDQLFALDKWATICKAVFAARTGQDWAPAKRRFSASAEAANAGIDPRAAELIARYAKPASGALHRDVPANSPAIDDQQARDVNN